MIKRQNNTSELKYIMNELINENKLEPKYKNHLLRGNYIGCNECHIEND